MFLCLRVEEGLCVFRNGLISISDWRVEEGLCVFRNGLISISDWRVEEGLCVFRNGLISISDWRVEEGLCVFRNGIISISDWRVEEGLCVFRNGLISISDWRVVEGFCVFRNGLISISDWVFGNVWSCSTLFIMKTSHKSDELKERKKGGSTNRVPTGRCCSSYLLLFCLSSACVTCTQMLPVSLYCPFLIAPSVFFWRLFAISLAYSIITSLKNITKLERRCKNRKTENFFFYQNGRHMFLNTGNWCLIFYATNK